MPSSLTHYFFAQKTSNRLPFIINQQIINLGCQGTDPFFFYGTFIKRKNNKDINNFATYIHHCNPFDFFNFFIKEANKQSIKTNKDLIYNYIYGLLNHYCLDRNCHPYVFALTGWGSKQHIIDHQKFEANIDCCLQYKYTNFISPTKTLKNKKDDVLLISNIYDSYSSDNKHYLPKAFYHSYKDMRFASKILYSHYGIRKWFFNTFIPNSTINAMSTPKKCEKDIDYLNEKRKSWEHPVSKLSSKQSFMDLMIQADEDFNKVLIILEKAYYNKEYKELLKTFINELIHDGIKTYQSMKYFTSVYDH